jgi:hypothetical protein
MVTMKTAGLRLAGLPRITLLMALQLGTTTR